MTPSEQTRLFALKSGNPQLGKKIFTITGIVFAIVGVILFAVFASRYELVTGILMCVVCILFGGIMALAGNLYTAVERQYKKKLETYYVNSYKITKDELLQRVCREVPLDQTRERIEVLYNTKE